MTTPSDRPAALAERVLELARHAPIGRSPEREFVDAACACARQLLVAREALLHHVLAHRQTWLAGRAEAESYGAAVASFERDPAVIEARAVLSEIDRPA